MSVFVCEADCLEVLTQLDNDSVDSVVTDPPYSINFMGRQWDDWDSPADYQQWSEQWAQECLRILKPGGYLLAFGGTRTYHRLACAVEDAGFEIRDSVTWLYGSGFPKSQNVSKAIDKAAGAEREVIDTQPGRMPQAQASGWGNPGKDAFRDEHRGTVPTDVTAPATDAAKEWDGWGTALKPASEPIVVARKPLMGTVVKNVLEHGTGALNIDGTRVETSDNLNGGTYSGQERERARQETLSGGPLKRGIGTYQQPAGRWPPNAVFSHSESCTDDKCSEDCPIAELDRQSGFLHGSGNKADVDAGQDADYIASSYHVSYVGRANRDYGAAGGGASRFFPTFRYQAKAAKKERPKVEGINHPTVKPLELMKWLIRLVTPPGGIVLDPFVGSGTTLEAAYLEGFRSVGIENYPDYIKLIHARFEKYDVELEMF